MRLEHLVEKELPADTILKEMGVPNGERQVIMEFLPLIPVALWAGGAAWTAYDTYQAKKAYDRGEITQAELATRVGTDVAISIAGGVLAKAIGKGFKVGKKIYKTKKEAKAAQKKTADIPTPKDAAVPPKGINVVANATTTTAKTSSKKAVQTAKPGDTIKTDKGEFLAGVDGKATTTRVSAPNAAEIKKQILGVVNKPKSDLATVVTKTELVPGANAAAKVVDKVKDVAPKLAKKVVDKTKDTGTKVVDKVKDLAKKSAPVSKDISAPAASVTSKAAAKQTTKKLTKKQQDALSSMGTPTASVTSKAAAKQTTKKLTKKQQNALSSMGKNLDVAVGQASAKTGTKAVNKLKGKVDDKLQKAADDAAHKKSMANTKKNQQMNKQGDFATPTAAITAKSGSKVATKKLDDIKKKQNKKDKKNKEKKKKKLGSYWSNLNKGNYWDTNLSGVAKKYSNF